LKRLASPSDVCRPPMPDDKIAAIKKWIVDDCSE
jgi:hypothetical protein